MGTPGRLLALIKNGDLKLGKLKHFVIDECDKVLEELGRSRCCQLMISLTHMADMRADVQQIFISTPREKQVMMFSATLPKDIRPVVKKFMHSVRRCSSCHVQLTFPQPMEIYVDDETKLTLHGLKQHYVNLLDKEKNRKLFSLLDVLDFNQARQQHSAARSAHCGAGRHLRQERAARQGAQHAADGERLPVHCHPRRHEAGGAVWPRSGLTLTLTGPCSLKNFNEFKEFKKRILVATNLFGRGIDIERVNIVFNYDMPESSDAYLHRVRRRCCCRTFS